MSSIFKAEIKKIKYLKRAKLYFSSLFLVSLCTSLLLITSLNITQSKRIIEFTSYDILSVSMFGLDAATIMLVVFIAIELSKEFNSKQLYFTIQTCPNRTSIYKLKMQIFLTISAITSVMLMVLMIVMTQVILNSNNMQLVNFNDINNVQLILGTSIMPMFYTIVVVAFSFIFRNTGIAITSTLGLIALPAIIKLLGNNLEEILTPLMPQSAIHSLAGTATTNSAEYSSIMVSLIILAIWIIVLISIGNRCFKKVDF